MTIFKGFTGGGESNSSCKAYVRKVSVKRESCPSSIIDEEAKCVLYPHDDALVATMVVANYTMR